MVVAGWRIEAGTLERPLVIAHRGGAGIAPENTLAAFRKAMDIGCDGIELDVRLTKDKQVAVIHDRRVDRTTNGSGLVGSHTMDQLRGLDVGSWLGPGYWGQRVSSLGDVFEELPSSFLVYVEIKARGPSTWALAAGVAELVRHHQRWETTMVASFNPLALLRLRMLDPRIIRGYIYSSNHPILLRQRWLSPLAQPYWYAPNQGSVSGPLVRRFHRLGNAVVAWDLETDEDLDKLAEWGIDAVVTDHPEEFIKRSRLLLEKANHVNEYIKQEDQ